MFGRHTVEIPISEKIWFWSPMKIEDSTEKVPENWPAVKGQQSMVDMLKYTINKTKLQNVYLRSAIAGTHTITKAMLPKGNYGSIVDALKAMKWIQNETS